MKETKPTAHLPIARSFSWIFFLFFFLSLSLSLSLCLSLSSSLFPSLFHLASLSIGWSIFANQQKKTACGPLLHPQLHLIRMCAGKCKLFHIDFIHTDTLCLSLSLSFFSYYSATWMSIGFIFGVICPDCNAPSIQTTDRILLHMRGMHEARKCSSTFTSLYLFPHASLSLSLSLSLSIFSVLILYPTIKPDPSRTDLDAIWLDWWYTSGHPLDAITLLPNHCHLGLASSHSIFTLDIVLHCPVEYWMPLDTHKNSLTVQTQKISKNAKRKTLHYLH